MKSSRVTCSRFTGAKSNAPCLRPREETSTSLWRPANRKVGMNFLRDSKTGYSCENRSVSLRLFHLIRRGPARTSSSDRPRRTASGHQGGEGGLGCPSTDGRVPGGGGYGPSRALRQERVCPPSHEPQAGRQGCTRTSGLPPRLDLGRGKATCASGFRMGSMSD